MVRYPKRAPCELHILVVVVAVIVVVVVVYAQSSSLLDEGRFININPLTGDDPNTFINASFIDVRTISTCASTLYTLPYLVPPSGLLLPQVTDSGTGSNGVHLQVLLDSRLRTEDAFDCTTL